MTSKLSGAITAALALSSASHLAHANVEPNTEVMVVTATKTEKSLLDAPVSISVVTQEDIARSGAASVAQMIKDVPGVELNTNTQPGMERIRVRNQGGGRTLVLVDGQRITDQSSPDGIPLLVDPASIERIEVVKGPSSVLYGSDAIGGVVNIITKRGGDRAIEGQVSTQYNSDTAGLDSRFSLSGGHNGYYYRVSGQYAEGSDQNKQFDYQGPEPVDATASYENKGVAGQFGYMNEKFDIAVNLETQDSYSSLEAPDASESWQFSETQRTRNKASVRGEYYSLNDYLSRVSANAYVQTIETEDSNELNSLGVAAQADLNLHDDHYIIVGYDGWQDEMDRLDSSLEGKQSSHAIFIQDEWLLPADLTLTLGARYTLIENSSNNPEYNDWSEAKPTVSAALTYDGIENTTLRSAYSQGFKAPILGQMYGTGSDGSMTFVPNYDLTHETSDNIEVGARYIDDRTMVDFAVFYSRAEDYINMYLDFGSMEYGYENVDSATMYGSELYLEHRIEDQYNLTPYSALTFSRRQDDKGDFKTWDTGTPTFDGKVGLKADKRLSHGVVWWADLNLRFATDADTQSSAAADLERVDGWQTLNVSTGVSYGTEQEYFASINLNNLLDKEYFTAYSNLTEPGFHAVAQVGIKF